MDFLINFLGLSFSLAILIWGADKFVDSASALAKRFGVNELTIGLTIIALGTSAPEIFVGISSVLNQSESIAMGTVVGSNISNIALIFGVSCIGISFKPKSTPFIQFLPFLISALVLGLCLKDFNISPIDGMLLLIVFIYFLYVIFKNKSVEGSPLVSEQSTENGPLTSILLVLGLLALILGSRYAVIYAENIAMLLKISELVIGLTIIAIGTSLPELAATISAILKKKTDMVVGNVIGSNVLNITLVVPIIGFFSTAQLEILLFSRDYLIMIFATTIFILLVTLCSSKYFNLTMIRLAGVSLIFGYFFYLLSLSNLV
ncbi:MAG: calcium:sodium antiporter [Gammaproteobacteria bacterium]|nr:calcium:sodium antiporter [Gammaproteobacteria bacterium]|tara:strand:+ start:9968 stop:10921 length:954 start_codon:yes stop_codon:yes gene_type:complete